MNCFGPWIKKNYLKADNAFGDLARDIAADDCFPNKVFNYQRLYDHLYWWHEADPAAIETLKAAHAVYMAERAKGGESK